jgi:hypothetical protein
MLRNLFAHLAKLGIETARLYPIWVGGGVLAVVLLGLLLRRQIGRALSSLKELRPFLEHFFQIACGALLLLLFLDFVDVALAPNPDFKALAALATTLLVLALGAQYGQHLFARLKKLGPLELFEKRCRSSSSGYGKSSIRWT